MNYISVHDAAEKWGLPERRVTLLCREGKITGTKKEGKFWLIPDNAPLPQDGRTKAAKAGNPANEEKQQEKKRMGKYFGTDGFRGKAGVVLTAEHAFKTGRFIGHYFATHHQGIGNARIVIGKDTRRSSYMFENALAAGITSSGADAYLLHVTTTPCVSYITRTEHFDCGVMISASHNPFYDNGIKLMNAEGEKMEDELQLSIEDYIDGLVPEIPYATDEKVGATVDFYSGRNRYIGYLTGIPTRSFENCRVALDCSNGASWMIARSVFDALGAKSYVINNTPDGTNVNMNCGSTHIEELQKYVRNNHLDCGFAFDGDADRCIAVDEYGDEVNGDAIIYLAAKYFKDRGQLPSNTVVTTIMSNFGLYKALDRLGVNYEKTNVGDRYVYECMKANHYMIGGEQSGHIIFRRYAHTGDGLVTALMVMQIMNETQLPLSVLIQDCKMYPQVLKNVIVDDKAATLDDPAVKKAVQECTDSLGESGRVLLRASGTEPVLRVMSEAETFRNCENQVDHIIEAMKNSGHLIKVKN